MPAECASSDSDEEIDSECLRSLELETSLRGSTESIASTVQSDSKKSVPEPSLKKIDSDEQMLVTSRKRSNEKVTLMRSPITRGLVGESFTSIGVSCNPRKSVFGGLLKILILT